MIHQYINPFLAVFLITLIASSVTYGLVQQNVGTEDLDSLPQPVQGRTLERNWGL